MEKRCPHETIAFGDSNIDDDTILLEIFGDDVNLCAAAETSQFVQHGDYRTTQNKVQTTPSDLSVTLHSDHESINQKIKKRTFNAAHEDCDVVSVDKTAKLLPFVDDWNDLLTFHDGDGEVELDVLHSLFESDIEISLSLDSDIDIFFAKDGTEHSGSVTNTNTEAPSASSSHEPIQIITPTTPKECSFATDVSIVSPPSSPIPEPQGPNTVSKGTQESSTEKMSTTICSHCGCVATSSTNPPPEAQKSPRCASSNTTEKNKEVEVDDSMPTTMAFAIGETDNNENNSNNNNNEEECAVEEPNLIEAETFEEELRLVDELCNEGTRPAELPLPPETDSVIHKLEANDVFLGRGGQSIHHPGNIKFRDIVMEYLEEYRDSPKATKTAISRLVVQRITQDLGGRFLTRKGNAWMVVSLHRARVKTAHRFREALSKKGWGQPLVQSKPKHACDSE